MVGTRVALGRGTTQGGGLMAISCAGCGRSIAFQDALCPSCGRFVIGDLPPQQVRQREAGRGPARIVVLSVFLGFFGGLFATGFAFARLEEPKAPRASRARLEVLQIQPVAEKWVADHDGECPTVRQLVDANELAPGHWGLDPWGNEYVIDCDGAGVTVRSIGPDGALGSTDDVAVR